MPSADLLTITDSGLYCPAGDFYVDPWRPVNRAIVTHAHSDHARWGSERYLTTPEGRLVLQGRMGPAAMIETLPYGKSLTLGGVKVSLHPAGHVLGSAQVRIEHTGAVWVVSGDYKLAADPTCARFEPIRCHTFITESTFGLPIYRWPETSDVIADVIDWWQANREEGVASIVFTYALGKAQRLIASLGTSVGPIYCHGAVESVNATYRASGVDLPPTMFAGRGEGKRSWDGALVVAPPSAAGSPWLRKFGDISTAFASGWMLVRGTRRRRAVDRGFVFSDHADWPGLCEAIRATGAQRVLVTHGSTAAMSRWLNEQGIVAEALETRFEGEVDETSDPEAVAASEAEVEERADA
jgi:putative mRNA 3-end processing factor